MPDESCIEVPPTKFITLDSSLLGNIARDYFSANRAERRCASNFLHHLTSYGFVPMLCWHQLEELLKHRNHDVVSNRVAFLRSLPLVAWVPPLNNDGGLGSVVDILVSECRVACESSILSPEQIRDRVRNTLIRFGAGEQVMSPYLEIWEELRPYLWEQEARAREIVAISRANVVDVSKKKASDFINGQIRPRNEALQYLLFLRGLMAKEIDQRGDRRISNADVVASDFYQEIERGSSIFYSDIARPVLTYLEQLGIEPNEIQHNTRMEEVMELAEFRSKLRVAHRHLTVPWTRLKLSATPTRIPSWIIESPLKKYGQDHPERKGSELNDNHLACLAAYSDLSYVDKRTKENFRRAFRRNVILERIVNQVESSHSYQQVMKDIENLHFKKNQAHI